MENKFKFPDNFLWGAATSSHQVEGDNINNDWWKWESEGKFGEPSGKACNQYDLFKRDFKLAKSLNHNTHRFSLEWSRIEPREGKFDRQALAHYKEVIRELRQHGIEPIVTLNHFTLPLWFYEKGGWIGKGSEYNFAAFAEKVAEELGESVTYWLTVNEPVGNLNNGYITGAWPPGRRSVKEAVRAVITILRAHCLAYRAIHRVYNEKRWHTPKVSMAQLTVYYTPFHPNSKLDRLSAGFRHYYVNKFFINSLISGWCAVPGMPLTRLPQKNSLDFIGLNYYSRNYVRFAGFSPFKILGKEFSTLPGQEKSVKKNCLNWEIYPEGLYKILMEFAPYKLPILITENGICTNDDNERIDFIEAHLKEVARAVKDGAQVSGYLYWSLLDNFEWTNGYRPKFGLIEVDYATQRRTVRPSARIYADIIKNNAI